MVKDSGKNIWGFVGRFALVYFAVYLVMALIFVNLQAALPASARIALDFYEPYRLGLPDLLMQLILGGLLALVLYPFYDLLLKGKNGVLILFAALWGIALLGNLEPKPGSLEGMIYTTTTFFEHFLVLAVGAAQFMLFSFIILRWENMSAISGNMKLTEGIAAEGKKGYVFRFTLVHLVIYWLIGSIFYEISGYEEALATMETFELWRPLENLPMVAAVFFGQIFRGAIIGLLLYPFYHTYMNARHGWLLLFGLLFGLKVLPAILTVPESLSAMLVEAAVGLPEILAQTLIFALVFYAWENRRKRKIEKLAA